MALFKRLIDSSGNTTPDETTNLTKRLKCDSHTFDLRPTKLHPS